ncbi:MAG: hypothetical protein HY420_01275, partial [Candidatus Kerfeldbacteria bacterium]|nr:hypothetical protein [Candidatus Kerfeldbacteria bacterium]
CGTGAPGQNGAWQEVAANVLAPTNTAAAILVNSATSTITVLHSDTINASTTVATTFNLNSENFTDLTGTGLQNTAGVLNVNYTQVAPAGINGTWQSLFADTALTPTNTSAGIFVRASSTIDATLRVTDALSVADASVTRLSIANTGALTATSSVTTANWLTASTSSLTTGDVIKLVVNSSNLTGNIFNVLTDGGTAIFQMPDLATATTTLNTGIKINGSRLVVNANENRVGIGTDTPSSTLDIFGPGAGSFTTTFPAASLAHISNPNDTHYSLVFSNASQGVAGHNAIWVKGNGAVTSGALVFTSSNNLYSLSITPGGAIRTGTSPVTASLASLTVTATSTDASARSLVVQARASQVSNLLDFENSSSAFLSGFTAAGGLLMNIASATALTLQNGSGSNVFVVPTNSATATTTLNTGINIDANTLVVNANENRVGVGTDSPTTTLGVVGATRLNGNVVVTGTLTVNNFTNNCNGSASGGALSTNASGDLVCTDDDTAAGGGVGSPGAWQSIFADTALTPTNTSAGIFVRASSTIDSTLRINNNLSVIKASDNAFLVNTGVGDDATTTVTGYFRVASSTASIDTPVVWADGATGRVGINTSAPTTTLGVVGATRLVGTLFASGQVTLDNLAGATTRCVEATSAGLLQTAAGACGGGSGGSPGAWQSIFADTSLTPTNTSAGIFVRASSTFDSTLRVNSTTTIGTNTLVVNTNEGRVGVGTASPTTTFAVVGTSRFNGAVTVAGVLTVDSCIGCGVATVTPEVFTADGTWNRPSTLIQFAQVIVTGSGGGGGAADTDGSTAEDAAGGGGAGATTIEMLTAAELGASQVVTVGIAGIGDTDVATGGGTGGNGNTSSFGSLLSALGGSGGVGDADVDSNAGESWAGGAGGAAGTTGDVNLTGGSGGSGVSVAEESVGGSGGASYWGGGGRGGVVAFGDGAANGTVGVAYGSGGGGGANEDSTTNANGGDGAAGVVVIFSYVAGGGDLAEWYETKGGVEPGDVVAISRDFLEYESFALGLQKTSILERAVPGSSVVGVVSAMPFEIMGGDLLGASKDARPIALAGRVPVKVSEESGKIKAGDHLTISSIPGVAMRATKAGMTIGRALEDSDCEEGKACKVLVLVNTSYSSGVLLKTAMKADGIELDTIPGDLDVGRVILAQMIREKQNISASSTLSEIFTDRVIAGLEVIAPRVLTDQLVVNSIEAVDKDITLNLTGDGRFIINGFTATSTAEAASSTPAITFDSFGNAFFAGEVRAGKFTLGNDPAFDLIASQITDLSGAVKGLSDKANSEFLNLTVVGGLDVQGALTAGSEAEFQKTVSFLSEAEFGGYLYIRDENKNAVAFFDNLGNADFAGQVKAARVVAEEYGGPVWDELKLTLAELASSTAVLQTSVADLDARVTTLEEKTVSSLTELDLTGGLIVNNVTVLNGGLRVDSLFSIGGLLTLLSDAEFIGRPYFNADTAGFAVVKAGSRTAQVVFDQEYLEQPIVSLTISMESASSTELALDLGQSPEAQFIFDNDIRYVVTQKSAKGFLIFLNNPAPQDIRFSWVALAVKSPKIFESTLVSVPEQSPSAEPPAPLPPPEPVAPEETVPGETASPEVTTPLEPAPPDAALPAPAEEPVAPPSPAESISSEPMQDTSEPVSGEPVSLTDDSQILP